jgi:putative Ca2+/H+ antiporter (TMEM165/GDT1 family)
MVSRALETLLEEAKAQRLLGATLPERWIRLGAGLLFVAMGVWMLAGSWRQA